MPACNASEFDPPAPIAYVTLRNRLTGATWVDVPMQLDSGADVTLVPQAAVSHLFDGPHLEWSEYRLK